MVSVVMTGTLTRDPEMKGSDENKVCSMRRLIELNAARSPVIITVAAFGKQAVNCMEHLAKGRHVVVSGRLRWREWKGGDGKTRSEHSLAADRVDFLPGGSKVSEQAGEGE